MISDYQFQNQSSCWGLSRSRWFSNRQTNIFTRISDVLTALRSAESKANKKSNTGRCLALFLYQDFGCIGAAVKKVQQKQSVCSVTGLEITLTLH